MNPPEIVLYVIVGLILFGTTFTLTLPLIVNQVVKWQMSRPYRASDWKNKRPHGTLPRGFSTLRSKRLMR